MLRSIIITIVFSLVSLSANAESMPKVGDRGTTVWEDGATYTVTILKIDKARCFVSWDGWDASHNAWRPCKDIRVVAKAMVGQTYKPGQKGTTVWKGDGKTYPLTILKVDGARCYVTWPTWDSSFDEWRPCSSILITPPRDSAIKVGDTGTVVWKDGKTYTLTVRKMDGNRCYVSYKGWGAEHNEWRACASIQK